MERGTGTEISLLNIKHEHDFSVFFNLNKKFPKWVFESAIYLAFISSLSGLKFERSVNVILRTFF